LLLLLEFLDLYVPFLKTELPNLPVLRRVFNVGLEEHLITFMVMMMIKKARTIAISLL